MRFDVQGLGQVADSGHAKVFYLVALEAPDVVPAVC